MKMRERAKSTRRCSKLVLQLFINIAHCEWIFHQCARAITHSTLVVIAVSFLPPQFFSSFLLIHLNTSPTISLQFHDILGRPIAIIVSWHSFRRQQKIGRMQMCSFYISVTKFQLWMYSYSLREWSI